MNSVSTWQQALNSSWIKVWASVLGVLPTIVGAIVVFAVGLIIAFWLKRFVLQVLDLIKFDKFSQILKIDKYLTKADIKFTLSELIATIVEWIIILVFFLTVVDILGLSVVSQVLTQVLGYIPNVVAAALIFAAGYIVAGVADGLIRGALASVDHDIAKPLGKVARWVILAIAVFAAIDQLQIARNLIATFFQGLTYTIVLVVGLSVGLGAKDLVSKVLTDWYEKIRK